MDNLTKENQMNSEIKNKIISCMKENKEKAAQQKKENIEAYHVLSVRFEKKFYDELVKEAKKINISMAKMIKIILRETLSEKDSIRE